MKKNGFIMSTYVYILLVFFLLLLGTMLVVLNNTRLLANKIKENTDGNIDFNLILKGDKEIILKELDDFIPDDDALAPADAASMSLLKEQLADVLKTLTPREAKVLSLRFGLDDGNPKTLEEVGKVFNVTRERIRQIEAKALRKLRHPSRSKKLKDFLD